MKTTEEYAELFHNLYEKLAPDYNYKTRISTKVFDKDSSNGRLMIKVTGLVIAEHEKEMNEERMQ